MTKSTLKMRKTNSVVTLAVYLKKVNQHPIKQEGHLKSKMVETQQNNPLTNQLRTFKS